VSPFASLEQGKYAAILADPPWHFKSNSAAAPGRNAMAHYACMSLADIAALPVKDLAAEDCALFLWITGPFLAIGAHHEIMEAWGFKPSGMGFVWVKTNPRAASLFTMKQDLFTGGGFTTRKNAEFCLIGKRGRSVRIAKDVHEIIIAPRRQHSRKPDEVYERVQRYCVGPYLELFSRQQRPGWTCWGNEVDKFSEAAE
jgi:N6-adenosine-specific RNA methylase IME4